MTRADAFREIQCREADGAAGAAWDVPKALGVAFPLDEFYLRSGRRMPEVEEVDAAGLPEPSRTLLAHNNDMTPTLSAYHARLIHLRVLSRAQRDNFYFREVVLVADGTEQPVEFGAIRINLALFTPALRRFILDERVPLGHLLGVHSITHSSRPQAFFRLMADALMIEALQLPGPRVLYGRRNTLFNASFRPLAEVVEILPPLAQPPAGYFSKTQGES
jgi:hypothetical protein